MPRPMYMGPFLTMVTAARAGGVVRTLTRATAELAC